MKTFFSFIPAKSIQLTGIIPRRSHTVLLSWAVFLLMMDYGINKPVVAAFWANTESLGVKFSPFKDYMTVNFSALELSAQISITLLNNVVFCSRADLCLSSFNDSI